MLPVFTKISDNNSILITIDDGPNIETTPILLDVLDRYGAKANFFGIGQKIEANFDLAQEIIKRGHTLHHHGFSHRSFMSMTKEEIFYELDATEALLQKLRPTKGKYLIRLPYGAGFNSEIVHSVIESWRSEAVIIQWSMTPQEWLLIAKCNTPSDVVDLIDEGFNTLKSLQWGGGILLLHDWPVIINNEIPQISHLRPYFCATMLEKTLIFAKESGINFAILN